LAGKPADIAEQPEVPTEQPGMAPDRAKDDIA
jgi:hypothetical protein